MIDNVETVFWSARKVPPIAILQVVGVFIGFISSAFLVFYSMIVSVMMEGPLGKGE